ncbi:hypothetical protein LITTLEE_228 [Mycobacterium phage LittleE]|uniref:Uncharacterized protein n=1 Tax=Mycobacterium phage LittleE TaxID=2922212 RepID=G1D4B2_9CAUD|nr:hypothetical protein FGG27_gp192 [Mycobacterium phage LittleE]AEK09604.1 hypothetical protein LITTLEE_228 [Mycobacterium phage LittleE]
MNNAYITGQRVADSRDASKIGTVVETRGGMWNDSAVLVHWDYLGYANWEMPRFIRPSGRQPAPNGCVEPSGNAVLLLHVADGCELFAEVGGETIDIHATTPWDTHVELDNLSRDDIAALIHRLQAIIA